MIRATLAQVLAQVLALVLALVLAAGPVWAEDAGRFDCHGDAPDWTLTIDGQNARLRFDGRDMAMTVDVSTRAEGRDFPRAASLLAGEDNGYDTAIALLDTAQCQSGGATYPMRGHLLTQIGNRAALLTGCCRPAR